MHTSGTRIGKNKEIIDIEVRVLVAFRRLGYGLEGSEPTTALFNFLSWKAVPEAVYLCSLHSFYTYFILD